MTPDERLSQLLLWRNLDGWRGWATSWRAESTEVTLEGDRLSARGTQLGVEPAPYRLDYHLTTHPRWITERLTLSVRDESGERRLDLRHDGGGTWTQRYEPIDARHVRYVTIGEDFQAELELDDHGLAIRYPYLAERVQGGSLGGA